MYSVKQECPICSYGEIGFFRCSDGRTIVLLCNECSATWLSPEDLSPDNADGPQPPDFKLSNLDCAIKGGASGWAALEEIKSMNWSSYIET